MKKLRFFLTSIFLLCCSAIYAYDFKVDKICYDTLGTNATVTEGAYSGKVIIPETVVYNGVTYDVTSIGYYAFGDCSGLTSVVIPNSVTHIGERAFEGCSGLTSVEIPNSVTHIRDNAFEGCSGLTAIEIPESVTSMGNYTFKGCSGLTSIKIPEGVTSFGWGVFSVCSSLISVKIPNSVTHIGGYAFSGCSGLTSIEIPNSVNTIENSAFSGCSGMTSLIIGSSVTHIWEDAFDGCSGLTSIVVNEDNKTYDSREGCNAIIERSSNRLIKGCKSTRIPNSVTSIGSYAFIRCSGLTSVEIPNSVTSIGNYAFYGCSGLTSVEIPNRMTDIGKFAFYDCSELRSVEIPESVTSIGMTAFPSDNIVSMTVADGNAKYDSRENCNGIIETETNKLIWGCNTTTIPSTVTSYGDYAFKDCSGLTSIDISENVISIGQSAFEGCSGLISVNIPNSVTSIGEYAFRNCPNLVTVDLPDNLTKISKYTFYECSALTSIEIPNSVTSIGGYAFERCSGLTSVVIGNSVTYIGSYAFDDCNNLKSVTSLNPTPPATEYWFGPFTNHDATLYVPFGAKDAYSEANNWKNFTNIEELEPSIYELTDGEEYNEASDMTVETLTYTRTLPNLHWNALYVPFELPYDVIADRYDVAYINDVNGYDTDGNGTIDDLAMEIITIKGGTLKANYPYLIKAKTEADKAMNITVEDATLYAAEENAVDCSSVYQNYVVKGTYTKKTAEELAGKLAISTSGAWQPLAEGTALNPFRLYLSIENRDNSPLKVEPAALSRMRIVERGETTGIEEVVSSQQREDIIFDLSGRRVKQPVKGGVYIVNGKKRIL